MILLNDIQRASKGDSDLLLGDRAAVLIRRSLT